MERSSSSVDLHPINGMDISRPCSRGGFFIIRRAFRRGPVIDNLLDREELFRYSMEYPR